MSFSLNSSDGHGSFSGAPKRHIYKAGSDMHRSASASQKSSTDLRKKRDHGKGLGSRASSMSSKDYIEKILFRNNKDGDDSINDDQSRQDRLRTIADRTDTLISGENIFAPLSPSDLGRADKTNDGGDSEITTPTPNYKIVPDGQRN